MEKIPEMKSREETVEIENSEGFAPNYNQSEFFAKLLKAALIYKKNLEKLGDSAIGADTTQQAAEAASEAGLEVDLGASAWTDPVAHAVMVVADLAVEHPTGEYDYMKGFSDEVEVAYRRQSSGYKQLLASLSSDGSERDEVDSAYLADRLAATEANLQTLIGRVKVGEFRDKKHYDPLD